MYICHKNIAIPNACLPHSCNYSPFNSSSSVTLVAVFVCRKSYIGLYVLLKNKELHNKILIPKQMILFPPILHEQWFLIRINSRRKAQGHLKFLIELGEKMCLLPSKYIEISKSMAVKLPVTPIGLTFSVLQGKATSSMIWKCVSEPQSGIRNCLWIKSPAYRAIKINSEENT